MLVDSTGQKMYYAYYPFGETIEASGSHGTEFRFTGKEREDHSGFEFDYFGARYYDPRIGSFTTIDKASQFASGYVYGGNNPLGGVDPDGNWFWSAIGYAWQAYGYFTAAKTVVNTVDAAMEGDWVNVYLNVWTFGASQSPALKHRGGHLGGHIAKNVGFNVGMNALGNTMQGESWSHGWGYAAGLGAVGGVMSSQHYANWRENGEFRSYESSIKLALARLKRLQDSQIAAVDPRVAANLLRLILEYERKLRASMRRGKANATAGWLGLCWATGLGPTRTAFGPNADITQELKNSRVVELARERYYAGRHRPFERVEFGTSEFFAALWSDGITDDFVGSLDHVSITDLGDGNLRFVAVNNTDAASFTKYLDKIPTLYDAKFSSSSYNRHWFFPTPGGRITQTYIWTEPIRRY